ncbi:MAG: AAA family ATPase [Bacteroidetes bacterium]|nr:AAA family ATPase [Bacteroidota bacterium]
MASTSFYLRSIQFTNIRTFKNTELSLVNEQKILPQWTILLGENGIGKSTVLQCIAGMLPSSGSLNQKKEDNAPYITNEENESLLRLVRKSSTGTVQGRILATFITGQQLMKSLRKGKEWESKISIRTSKGNLDEVEDIPARKPDPELVGKVITLYAYSASRKLGKLNLKKGELQETIPQLFSESTELFDAESILHTTNYAMLGAKEGDYSQKKFITDIKSMLSEILPDIKSPDDIEIVPPKLGEDFSISGDILLNTKFGQKLSFRNFSLGYKSTISWTVDLAWRLYTDSPIVKNPLEKAAIVLIDEIDLHLHPKWQQVLLNNISSHFPNVQFIATAHSPLIVQQAVQHNYAVLRLIDEDHVQIFNHPKDVDGWRVDQILASPLFGLKSSRGPKYEKLYRERDELLYKDMLSKTEKKRLKNIIDEIKALPLAETI